VNKRSDENILADPVADACTEEAARVCGEAHAATYYAPAVVMRHSGRADGWWRPVMTGTPDACRQDYAARAKSMRRGAVAVYVAPRSGLPAKLLFTTAHSLVAS
jgi:hypothetical protein